MSLFFHTKVKQPKIDEINAYLRSRKVKPFTKKQIGAMDYSKDELGVLVLDIVVRGQWFDFDANKHQLLELKTNHSDDDVKEEDIKHVISLKSAMARFSGLCLDANLKPIGIMEFGYDEVSS